jgi:PAS domain-containing protein
MTFHIQVNAASERRVRERPGRPGLASLDPVSIRRPFWAQAAIKEQAPRHHYFRLVDKDGQSLIFRVHVAANSMEVIKVEVVQSPMTPRPPDAAVYRTVRINRSGITILQDSLK